MKFEDKNFTYEFFNMVTNLTKLSVISVQVDKKYRLLYDRETEMYTCSSPSSLQTMHEYQVSYFLHQLLLKGVYNDLNKLAYKIDARLPHEAVAAYLGQYNSHLKMDVYLAYHNYLAGLYGIYISGKDVPKVSETILKDFISDFYLTSVRPHVDSKMRGLEYCYKNISDLTVEDLMLTISWMIEEE